MLNHIIQGSKGSYGCLQKIQEICKSQIDLMYNSGEQFLGFSLEWAHGIQSFKERSVIIHTI